MASSKSLAVKNKLDKHELKIKLKNIDFHSKQANAGKGMGKMLTALKFLGLENPYSYFVFRYIRPRPARPSENWLPTCGVTLDKKSKNIVLIYNPLFFDGFDYELENGTKGFYEMDAQKDLVPILLHESYHVALSHIQRNMALDPKDARVMNVAQDIWINEHLKGLNENFDGENVKNLSAISYNKYNYNFLVNRNITEMSSIEIFNLLKDNNVDVGQNDINIDMHIILDGDGQTDQNGNPLSDSDKEAFKAAVHEALGKVAKNIKQGQIEGIKYSHRQERGTLPGNIEAHVTDFKQRNATWINSLSNFIASCKIEEHISTWKRPSRRFGFAAPHRKKVKRPKITIISDTSGSMFDKETLDMMATYVDWALDECQEIRLISIDTEIRFDEKLKKGDKSWVDKFAAGGGGTTLQSAFDAAAKDRPDGLIVCTDGFTDELNVHGLPTFALITENGVCPPGDIKRWDYI